MKTRRQHAAEEALRISRRSTQSPPVSIGNSETIPVDLIIEILLRLPPQSIPKCRRVSKLWNSILRRADFTELFITRSRAARPQLLLSLVENKELFLFTIPQEVQVQNQDSIPANYHARFPCEFSSRIAGPVRGLVCLANHGKPVMCNPSTGQSLPLPYVRTKTVRVNSYLGFDPIGKQFKILCMTTREYHNCEEHQVLTLGTKTKWRKIKCSISHSFRHNNHGICINGVVYYVAGPSGPPTANTNGVVCFDVRSEKFSVINRDEEMALCSQSTLVNYKGALGALLSDGSSDELTGETKCFELWVLVDADKHEWSKHISISLPPLWKHIVADAKLFFVGVTGTDEIVLSPRYVSFLSEPYCFHVYYYNIESNTVRRVEIQGMNAFRHCEVRLSLNHVEDVKLLQYI